MTDFYFKGYKITLVMLRGGSKVIVVRDSMNLRYITHFTEIGNFDKWIKEFDYGEVKRDEED